MTRTFSVERSIAQRDPATAILRVLSIAGTDPSGGAGIQADLKSIAACGGYGMAVVTAMTAQNTQGVRSIHVPPVGFLTEQLDSVSDDVAIDAVKIGMLASREIILAVTDWLDRVRPPIVVLDPVMVATSGDRLLDKDAEEAVRDLLGRADLVTPNIPELGVLLGEEPATTWEATLEQAQRLSSQHGVLVLAKGGHLEGTESRDALVDSRAGTGAGATVEFSAARVQTDNTHGTGCSFSSALATLRPQYDDWELAARQAKQWLTEAIAAADQLDVGQGHGPIHHFAGLWDRGLTPVATDAKTIARQWWNEIAQVRAAVDRCAFVRGLAEGTLDRDTFTWYLGQDALYLLDYSRALAAASALAPTPAEQAFWAQGANGAIVAELELHGSWLGEALTEAEPSPTTTAYVNHLLATAARGDYGVLIAAVLPCYWIYMDVGTRLVDHAVPENPFADWLRTYGDPAFNAATEEAIRLVSSYAASADPKTRERMWRAFEVSAGHELEFFEAPMEQPDAASSPEVRK
ncbi:bifunctional hydroxymethylpyrimidine kinase/phosphomethylpyrimidine kinase [Citricoccus sp. GCM10030269]|uniref:bifunctional hydroxymethylpyrimidine kinase/phosphomethylpyrimidine kinase n=1 Tax=Citricoccus sp. GCM10030269 TaxID=3273388 RepID=UPI00361EAAB5